MEFSGILQHSQTMGFSINELTFSLYCTTISHPGDVRKNDVGNNVGNNNVRARVSPASCFNPTRIAATSGHRLQGKKKEQAW
jgi:hypothetical protein